jgi:Amt family ammonium transporter
MAAAAAAVAWAALDWIRTRRPTALGLISGAVAGLVAVTPASGYVTPLAAVAIGLLAGLACYGAVMFMKGKLGYDDSLDAFGVHGIGGMLGALATGLWATLTINEAGADGLFHGNPRLLLYQVIAVVVSFAYSFVVSFGLLKLVDRVIGLRVDSDNENIGLDLTQHSEAAYTVVG